MRCVPPLMAAISLSTAVLVDDAAQQTADVPVTVVDDAVRVADGQLRFRLQNRATVPVTAWRVAAEYLLADGTSERIVYGREGYLAISGLGPPEHAAGRVVGAEGQTDVAILLPDAWPAVTSVRLQVESAVFADGSSFGPPMEIAAIFARRDEDRRAWQRVRHAFAEARKGGTEEAVAQAIAALGASADAGGRHPVVAGARRDLERLLHNAEARAEAGGLDAVLARWVQRADAHVAAATRHSARR
jgi:hypothetical protein